MTSLLFRLGRGSASRPWTVIGLWLALATIVVAASGALGADHEDSFGAPGVDSQRAVDLLSDAGSSRAGVTARVVVGSEAAAGVSSGDVDHVAAALAALPDVIDVSESTAPAGDVVLFTVQYPVREELGPDDLDRLQETVGELRGRVDGHVEAGGELFQAFEEAGSGNEELIGLAAAAVVLLLAFGSVIAMGLPIGIALVGLAIGTAAMPLIGHLIAVPSFAPQMGAMIGIGVGIDYALFLVTRHREFLARGLTVADAAGRAVETAGRAVIFAGGTVVIAILGLAVAGLPFMTAAAIATSVIVAIMVGASVTLLPALLGLAGRSINRFGLHRRGTEGRVSDTWRRWGSHVARHARGYAIGVVALLVALTAPVLALRLGFPDEGTQAESRTERRAYDLAAAGFGVGVNGPLVVAVDTAGAGDEVVARVSAAVAEDAGIAAVAPPELDRASGVASFVAVPNTAPQDDATFETVERLRAEILPGALEGSAATAHIGGQTASFGDVADRVADRLPWFIAAVVSMSFLLLMLVFRSILVPLKAALLNLLSIGAAYGVLVMVFQWGWGKELIGLETTVPIVSFIPMFMFAVLFGLSMDYEVFLLSRVREEYAASGDNHASVVAGLAGTARVITSAALIMISVFGAFVLGDDPIVKMLGLGLAVAIFVDATIVRIVLVPATMTLLGDANWWLPRWLDRRLPRLDVEGDHGETAEDDHVDSPDGDGASDQEPATDRPLVGVG